MRWPTSACTYTATIGSSVNSRSLLQNVEGCVYVHCKFPLQVHDSVVGGALHMAPVGKGTCSSRRKEPLTEPDIVPFEPVEH
eukprot:1369445-Amphidinium_carterae.1